MSTNKIWFTGDQHWGHANAIQYCDRPYVNVDKMDKALTEAWNDVVDDKDIVYHLGDVTLGKEWKKYLLSLNGHIIFILENNWHHDKRWLKDFNTGNELFRYRNIHTTSPIVVLEYPSLSDTEWPQVIVLCHYPLAEWDRRHYSAFHLHGHSHGNYHALGKILDVGVDNAHKLLGAYRPFELNEVKEIMDGLEEEK